MAAKYTRVGGNFVCDTELTGYENLAAAIINRAVQDARRLEQRGAVSRGAPKYNKRELISFFESSWCDALLGSTGYTGHDIRKAVGW